MSTGKITLRDFARRAYFTAAYRLYARRRLLRTDEARIFGHRLIVPRGVFHPCLYYSSKAFGEYLSSIPLHGTSVLDMGCGSGILALVAAGEGASVTAIDINPDAVRATRENASRNRREIVALRGDLFEPLEPGSQFDYILFNPPFYAGTPKDIPDMAWRAGHSYEVMREFLRGAPPHMRPSATLLLILSSEMPLATIGGLFSESGFTFERVWSKRAPFERLHIYRAGRIS